jgi:hypothetical protein
MTKRDIVNFVREARANGMTSQAIAEYLNTNEVKTAHNKDWTAGGVASFANRNGVKKKFRKRKGNKKAKTRAPKPKKDPIIEAMEDVLSSNLSDKTKLKVLPIFFQAN